MRGASHCVVAVLLIGLGGCANTPRLAIESAGTWPAAGKLTFSFGPVGTQGDEALRAGIANCLVRKGMTASPSAAYLIQVGLSDHPPGSQILPADEDMRKPPRPTISRWSRSLTISMADIGDGHEAYRIRVTGQYRDAHDRQPVSALTNAACDAIGTAAVTRSP